MVSADKLIAGKKYVVQGEGSLPIGARYYLVPGSRFQVKTIDSQFITIRTIEVSSTPDVHTPADVLPFPATLSVLGLANMAPNLEFAIVETEAVGARRRRKTRVRKTRRRLTRRRR